MSSMDLADLCDAVGSASENRRRASQLDARCAQAEAFATARSQELLDAQKRLESERTDVVRLERMSPTKLWSALRGDTDERLAVERAEAELAAAAVAGAQARLDSAIAEWARVRDERESLGDTDADYGAALAAYERALRDVGGDAGTELARIAEDLGAAGAERRELGEAVDALGTALEALEEALNALQSAGGWSTYDTFFDGGFIADMMKHDRIDTATQAFQRVNRALEHLTTELADINAPAVQGVAISESLAIFDIAFDNFFSDFMVRERIADAKASAGQLHTRLGELSGYLASRSQTNAARINGLLLRREAILTGAQS